MEKRGIEDGRGAIRAGVLLERRYRVDAIVAEGGFGEVYRGLHLTLEIPIAVKVMRLRGAESEVSELCAQFLEEARILSRLRHPNIVRVLDAGVSTESGESPQAWLVMEWCGGQTLRDYLRELDSPQNVASVWTLLRPLIEAVAAAHAQGIAHRDIKLSNIMIVEDDDGAMSARLIDFGISKRVDAGESAGSGSTRSTGPRGFTPGYAAPEQLTGARSGPWTDVHALALVITEMLIGESPYGSNVEPSTIVDPERPTPSRFGVDVGGWELVLKRALALKSADRYPDARALLDALEAALPETTRGSGPSAPEPVRLERSAKPRERVRVPTSKSERTELETLEHAATERVAANRARVPARSRLVWVIPLAIVAAGSIAVASTRWSSPSSEDHSSASVPPSASVSVAPPSSIALPETATAVAPPDMPSIATVSPTAESSAQVHSAPSARHPIRPAQTASASIVDPAPPPSVPPQAPERPTLH